MFTASALLMSLKRDFSCADRVPAAEHDAGKMCALLLLTVNLAYCHGKKSSNVLSPFSLDDRLCTDHAKHADMGSVWHRNMEANVVVR